MVAEASALCVDCGAGLCRNHLVAGQRRHATRAATGFGTGVEERWSRALRCRHCARTCSARESRPWSPEAEAEATS
jgi:hypothetical protein